MSPYFSLPLLKAVNDWQTGSQGKIKKAKRLRKVVEDERLERYLTECEEACYRRTIIAKESIMELLFEFRIPEETSSWTLRLDVAKTFKKGPPDPPYSGVIFRHDPKPEEVVLNLDRLYRHEAFWPSVEHWEKQEVLKTGSGIRRWANSQFEIVLDVESVPHTEMAYFGSNSALSIADGKMEDVHFFDGRGVATAPDVEKSFREAGLPTRRWITGEPAQRAFYRFVERGLALVEEELASRRDQPGPAQEP